MIDNENNQICCFNIIQNDDIYKSLPILTLKGQNDEIANLLIYKFNTQSEENYIVLGKINDKEMKNNAKNIISLLKTIISILNMEVNLDNYKQYKMQLEELCSNKLFKEILFTQEGFDLLNKKQFFVQNGLIARTIGIDVIFNNGDLEVGNNFFSVNEECKVRYIKSEHGKIKTIEDFDTWDKYSNLYFVNKSDLEGMTVKLAYTFSKNNYKRMLNFIRLFHSSWIDNHLTEDITDDKNKLMSFILQLLDVVFDFQNSKLTR